MDHQKMADAILLAFKSGKKPDEAKDETDTDAKDEAQESPDDAKRAIAAVRHGDDEAFEEAIESICERVCERMRK